MSATDGHTNIQTDKVIPIKILKNSFKNLIKFTVSHIIKNSCFKYSEDLLLGFCLADVKRQFSGRLGFCKEKNNDTSIHTESTEE